MSRELRRRTEAFGVAVGGALRDETEPGVETSWDEVWAGCGLGWFWS